MKNLILFTLISFSLLLTGCTDKNLASERKEWAEKDQGEIRIGVVLPNGQGEMTKIFKNGIQMALDQVNEKGVLGKQVSVVFQDDQGTVTVGSEIAEKFSLDGTISAVIGHWDSKVSDAVAQIYEQNGLVMISVSATSPNLIQGDTHYIFRKIDSDIEYSGVMAKYASEMGLDKIVICYSEDDYGYGLANALEDASAQYNIEVVDRTAIFNEKNFKEHLSKWRALDYNAIFIADSMPKAGELIQLLRESDVKVPILGGTGLDSQDLITSLKMNAEGIVFPSGFNVELDQVETETFVNSFSKRYGQLPDTWAVQGYETLMILCEAITEANSTQPEAIAKALHGIEQHASVTGKLTCDSFGEITTGVIYVKTIQKEKVLTIGEHVVH